MFEVGDVLRIPTGRFGDRYRVIRVIGNYMVLRNIRHTSDKMNFNAIELDHFILDEIYSRKKKLEKICSKLEKK